MTEQPDIDMVNAIAQKAIYDCVQTIMHAHFDAGGHTAVWRRIVEGVIRSVIATACDGDMEQTKDALIKFGDKCKELAETLDDATATWVPDGGH